MIRRARVQVPPEPPGFPPERSVSVSAVRNDPGPRTSRDFSHRSDRNRCRRPWWRWHTAQVLEPDVARRRGGRLPGSQHRPGASLISLAGRGAGGCDAQAERVHRSLRLVAEVFSAATRALRQHAVAGQGVVRLGLPAADAGPLARGLRHARHQTRRQAEDSQAQRDASPRAWSDAVESRVRSRCVACPCGTEGCAPSRDDIRRSDNDLRCADVPCGAPRVCAGQHRCRPRSARCISRRQPSGVPREPLRLSRARSDLRATQRTTVCGGDRLHAR